MAPNRYLSKVDHNKLCIVIGINNSAGLTILRDLGTKNIDIIGIDTKSFCCGKYSIYCKHFISYQSEPNLFDILLEIGKLISNKIPIMVSSDSLLIFIERNEIALNKYFLFHWQDKNKCAKIIDKNTMSSLATAAGLDVPLTFNSYQYSPSDIEKEMKWPAVVKPLYTKGKIKLLVSHSKTEFRSAIKNRLFDDGYIVQELVPGPEENIYLSGTFSNRNGELIANCLGIKLRQSPRNFGIATAAISIQNEQVKQLSEKLVGHIGYFGPADIEFKKSSTDGRYMFIEMNPRIGASNQLFTSSGCNLSYLCYINLINHYNRNPLKICPYRKVKYMSTVFDLITVIRYYENTSLIKWLRELSKSNSFAYFSPKDFLPFFVHIANLIISFLRKKKTLR